MGNEVTTTSTGGALAAYGGDNPFASAAAEMGGGGEDYLKFNGNTGDYTFGAAEDELEHGTKCVAHMDEIARGWICWDDGEVKDEITVRVIDGGPPSENTLPDHGPYDDEDDGWSSQVIILFSTNDGDRLKFKSSSKSGKRAFGTLLNDYAKQYKNHPDELPVVEINATGFMPKDKKISKKYAPTFRIVDWISNEEFAEKSGEDEGDYNENFNDEEGGDLPLKEEAKPEPEPEAEKPRRTSRGRAKRSF